MKAKKNELVMKQTKESLNRVSQAFDVVDHKRRSEVAAYKTTVVKEERSRTETDSDASSQCSSRSGSAMNRPPNRAGGQITPYRNREPVRLSSRLTNLIGKSQPNGQFAVTVEGNLQAAISRNDLRKTLKSTYTRLAVSTTGLQRGFFEGMQTGLDQILELKEIRVLTSLAHHNNKPDGYVYSTERMQPEAAEELKQFFKRVLSGQPWIREDRSVIRLRATGETQ
jgi:hypothetical protein